MLDQQSFVQTIQNVEYCCRASISCLEFIPSLSHSRLHRHSNAKRRDTCPTASTTLPVGNHNLHRYMVSLPQSPSPFPAATERRVS